MQERDNVHNRRTHLTLGKETVSDVSSTDMPGIWPDGSGSWNEHLFIEGLRVKTGHLASLVTEVDIVGMDASIANAIRRVLIAEVPTVAVENVYIWNNTSLVQDEVLAQRLGLVPLKIDPSKVEYKAPGDDPTDLNTMVFSLVVTCDYDKAASRSDNSARSNQRTYRNSNVHSSSFAWQPKGVQNDNFEADPPRPVLDDILIAKLRPKQEIVLEMHCEKGIGKDHAKWSPVATASYRLLPTISIVRDIPSDRCDAFAACFAPGVIEVTRQADGRKRVFVSNARRDTVSREVLRHPEFEDSVVLGRKRDHFIFSVESVGQYSASALLPAALAVLLDKVQHVRAALRGL